MHEHMEELQKPVYVSSDVQEKLKMTCCLYMGIVRRCKSVKRIHRVLLFLSLISFAVTLAMPHGAFAREVSQKTVRVGWFDSSFCYWDQFGRRNGIDYEYQQKISAYTGWTYEYVEGSWSNLFQMLIDGEIDLLSDVSYTQERTALMSFPDLPMGAEAYYIYVTADNREITAQNLSTFNGKRIGVNQGSVQEGFLKEWAKRNGLVIDVVPLVAGEAESLEMVVQGEIDGYTTIYTLGSEERVYPVCRVGESNFYYAVNKRRPDLLAELNMALSGIQDEDPYFNQRISEEHHFNTTKKDIFLTPDQEDWLTSHGAIRVGYLDDYLPFCQKDGETGELTGALKDYLAHAVNSLRKDIRFEAFPYASTEAALNALKAGEVDCVFPVNLSTYDADQMGVRLTDPAMKTEMNVVVRTPDHQSISRNSTITFAVTEGNVNLDTFIMELYPSCKRAVFRDDRECFEAVDSQKADCILESNYRIPEKEDIIDKYNYFSVPTGESMPFAFAVNRDEKTLYFILNRTATMTKSEDMDSALASYMKSNQEVSFSRFLRDHWIVVLVAVSAVFFVVIMLLSQKLKAERKANEQQRLLDEAAEIVKLKQTISSLLDHMPGMNFSKDAKTGVYLACNQSFADYAHRATPDDVIGHTAAEIFNAETAARFDEEDRIALSMDEPYIFFENVQDGAGNQRQLQTTKLKYTDVFDRQCVLGICQDVTNMVSVRRENAATKEDYEKARNANIIFTHIAQTLARGYTFLYYVNLDSEEFIEYQTDDESGTLIEARRGWHFFEQCQIDIEQVIHPDDRALVLDALDRKKLVSKLIRNKTLVVNYRILQERGAVYVSMRISRMTDDERYIVIGVMDVDEQMKQRRAAERMKEESIAYARLSALTGDYLCIYVVVPETGYYREISASASYEKLVQAKNGNDFFAATREAAPRFTHPEDLNRFLSAFTRENVRAEIERHGIFTLSYRVMMEGSPLYVQLKAAIVEEKGGARLIVGINDIDAQVRQEEAYVRRLAQARKDVNIDALTGVKNRHAYLEAEERLNAQIAEQRAPEFAIVILDVNDLKKVNDTDGHKAGDQYLRNACKIICDIFKHSPVFRIGGDEFAVIAQGSDYAGIEALIEQVCAQNTRAKQGRGIVIACGMAKYAGDASVAPVFERADQNMYENKSSLKAQKA